MGYNQSNTNTSKKLTEEEQRNQMTNHWANYKSQNIPQENNNENKEQRDNSKNENKINKKEEYAINKPTERDKLIERYSHLPINEETKNIKEEPKNIILSESKNESENVIHLTLKPQKEEFNNINNEDKKQVNEKSKEINIEHKEINIEHKEINIEHNSIEKIFKITLDENLKEKYYYLELYKGQLLSKNEHQNINETEFLFKLDNLDEIILSVINDSIYNDNIINYLLNCYHRAYQIINIKFKEELGSEYKIIKLTICTYLSQIIFSPLTFDITDKKNLDETSIKNEFEKYYNEQEENEFNELLKDLITATDSDYDTMKIVFHYIFIIMDIYNKKNQNLFNCSYFKRNLSLLIELFNYNDLIKQCYLDDSNFLLPNSSGKMLQINSFLGTILTIIIPFECEQPLIANAFPKNLKENDPSVNSCSNKLFHFFDDIEFIIYSLLQQNPDKIFNFFYLIINQNFEYTKMNKNLFKICSVGFILNCFIISCKLFFKECQNEFINDENFNIKNINYLIKLSKKINILFSNNDKYMLFSKYEFVSSEICAKYREENNQKSKEISYNKLTHLFYISHCLLNYTLSTLEKIYTEVIKNVNSLGSKGISEQLKIMYNYMRSFDLIIKNNYFDKLIMDFNRLSMVFVILINNINEIIELKDDDNYFEYLIGNLDLSSNIKLSSLPNFIIENIYTSSIFMRKFSSKYYYSDNKLIKELIYFSIVYSSKMELIHNPYSRSQIFDIMLHSFLFDEHDRLKNVIISCTGNILKDKFIQENLINSLIIVFVDAERLGTSNQFYEKFNIRNKVLLLIENLFKKHETDFKNKILDYANKNEEEIKKMLLLLMSDVNYIKDEVIMKLIDIKQYQELKDNIDQWNELSQEDKTSEEQKFMNNDRQLRPLVQMLNSSLGFFVIICSCLQDFFIRLKIAEKLANLLNCCLNEFTSKSSIINIKNKSEYNFKPELIISSLVEIYVAFIDYDPFIEFVVKDEGFYKYANFELAIEIIQSKSKVQINYEIAELFNKFVYEKLIKIEKEVKENEINYDDAPDEFLDSITSVLMNDPVMLPKSNMICDRETIEIQLVSNPIDPFNRSPLTKDMLIPQTELKQKIDKYKEEKRSKKNK